MTKNHPSLFIRYDTNEKWKQLTIQEQNNYEEDEYTDF